MDDLIHSCATPGKAIQSINELDRVLATESFQINEWLSSSNAVQQSLNSYPRKLIMKFTLANSVSMDGDKRVKTISVGWNLQMDVLSFEVKETMTGKFMRRAIISSYTTPQAWNLHSRLELKSPYRTFGDQSTMTRTISSLTIWSSCGETYSDMFRVWRLSSSRNVYSLSVSQVCLNCVFSPMQVGAPVIELPTF